jgi:hypothetical protein
MFLYVLPVSCTVMVQGGTSRRRPTRWYKVVHDGTRNGIWRYMEVHGSHCTRICKTVHTGMYWNILFLTVQSGSSWIRCCKQCCPAKGAVLKTSASNHSNASSSMFQSISLGLATALRLCRHAAPGEALVAQPERGGAALLLPPPQGPAAAQLRRSRLEVPLYCCCRHQRRQRRGLALVRMQPW